MGTAEERMRILKMLEEGTITPDEAASLLQALGSSAEGRKSPAREARWLRVRITDLNTRENKVSIDVSLIQLGQGALIVGELTSRSVPTLIFDGP